MEIIKLGIKHKLTLLISVLICALAGAFIGIKYGSAHIENSIFIDISIQDKFQKTSAYENLQAADQITESIQGWIKDPSFQDAVNKSETGPNDLIIQAKRQEKNNLIITFKSQNTESAINFGTIIIQVLQNRIQEYNTHSDLLIFANNQPLQSSTKDSQLLLYIALASLSGLVLGLFFMTILKDFQKRIHSN